MQTIRFYFKTPSPFRCLASLLIFALASPPLGYAQQTRQPQTPQPRILTQEDPKTSAAKPSGPRVSRPELVLQTGVTAPAYNAVFSPDGRLLASMDWMAGSIKLWEIASGRELCAINLGARAAATYAINSAFAFSSDGSSLFSVSAGTLKQWDTRSGRQLRAADLNQGKDFGLVYFSADARLLATTTEARSSLAVWDVGSGRKLQELKLDSENSDHLVAFALSADGRTLATNIESDPGRTRLDALTLRDATSGRVIQTIKISEQKLTMTMAMATSRTYTSPVRAIRFSPDGRAVAVAFHDTTRENPQVFSGGQERVTGRVNKIRAWDVSGGRELISLDAGAQSSGAADSIFDFGMTNTLAFSNDGRQCAIASGNTIKLFDPTAGRNLATIIGHTGEVIAVSFSADGKLLATISLDSTIKIWDVSAAAITGRVELAQTLSGMAMPVENAAFSGDGRALSVSGANTVTVWELNTGAAMRTITRPAVALDKDNLNHHSLSVFSAGGQLIAAQSGENEIKLWETRTGREVKSFPLSQGKKFDGGGVSPDGKWVALAERQSDSKSASGAADLSGGPASSTQPNAPQSAQGFPQFPPAMIPATPPDPTGNSKQDEKARKKADKEQMKEMKKRQEEILGQMMGGKKMDRSQMEKMAEQAQKNAEQMQKVMESGDIGKAMEMIGNVVQGMPGMAAMTQPRVNIRLWDLNAASEPRSLPGKPSLLKNRNGSAFTFNSDGSLLASATGGPSFKINEVASGRELFTLSLPRSYWVDSLAWSADGRLLASSQPEARAGVNFTSLDSSESYSGLLSPSIKLWDAATGRELRTMTGHTANVRVIAFSPDSRLLASAGEDAMVKLWETATGREIATLNGHSLSVNALAFSSDGKLLASGSDDGSARLWNVESGEALVTLVTLNDGADWLVVTPDGLFDGTPGAWGQILWRFNPNDIFDVAPVEIFFNEFFYPGLLSDIASGKRPRAARNVEQKDRRQPNLKLSRAEALGALGRTVKVKVEVSEPASDSQATPAGASDVRLFRNGTLVKFWRGDALKGQKQATLEAEIPIVAGENRLLAYAFNRDGVKSSDAVLTITGDESLRRKGVAYIVACGVNQYANAQYNLKYAVADATSFAEEIRAQQMKLQEYERVEVIPLLDREATKANILLALNRLSNSQAAPPADAPPALSKIQPAQPEDAVLLFFAGHGAAQGARFYLIPHDLGYAGARNALDAVGLRTILSHGVSDLELEAALEGVDAGRMIFVLDACNSGQALEAEEKRRGPMNSTGLAQLAYEKGMYILTAAQSYQAALEAAELGHGYLTFALIEDGLKKGLADRDPKDGLALAREWFNYAEERVPQMQEREMQTRLLLDFTGNDAKAKDPKQRNIQRPRVFYRRELEARPFVVAKP
jgi:WD40 repeat protein/uncharacterized caspase-like protein